MHNILTDTCAVCQTNCWRKQRPVSAFLCLAWPSWTLLKQRERFCESLCIQVSLSRRLSPWILPFSFPLLYCLLLCNFPAFLLLSHGKKPNCSTNANTIRDCDSWPLPAAGEVKVMPESISPLVRENFSSLCSEKSVSSGFIWVLSPLLWVLRQLSQCRMRSVVMPISGNWTPAWNVLKWHSLGRFPASSTTSGPFGAECTPIKEVKKPVH